MQRTFGGFMKRRAASWLSSFLGRRGYIVTRARFAEESPIDLRGLLASSIERRKGRFEVLQIGANDGVENDPIHKLVLSRGWYLCAVEPMPRPFQRLQTNYRDMRTVTCLQCAVGHVDGETTLYTLASPRAHSVDDHLSSFSIDVLRKHWRSIPDLEQRITTQIVKCLTFDSVVRQSSLHEIDMLQIDTEGYDYEIIKMAFNAGLFPPILAFEWQHLDRQAMFACRCDLIKHGYRWLLSKGDVIAMKDVAACQPTTAFRLSSNNILRTDSQKVRSDGL
jgi:FkbM family methyltransferase